jgi:hypothetical protein
LVAIALPLTWWGRQYANRQRQPAIAVFPSSQQTPTETSPEGDAQALSTADESAIASVIQQQLNAFQADDADLAFSLASPNVQDKFQTAEQFMTMVKAEYETVYRPQSINFEEIGWIRGKPIQAVTILGPSGEWMTAYYQMEQQTDQTWRIAGCVLIPMKGETI